jgi:hypothetical protein
VTTTEPDGSITTVVTIVTSTGSTTTTSTIQGAVETTTETKEGTGAIVSEGNVDKNGNEKKVETSTKKEVTLDGTKKETTVVVKDTGVAVNTKPVENADGSKTAAKGQTKDMGLPSPKKEAEIIMEEARAVFRKGPVAIKQWIMITYRIYMRLMIRWKQDEDNVQLQLEVNRARQKYQNMQKAIVTVRKEEDEKDPKMAKKREEFEIAKKEAEEKAKEE